MTDWRLRESVQTQAGEVRYDIMGEGPALVLVHGTPTWSYLWRRVAGVLARDFRVYLYDLPGYGTSAKFEGQDVSIGMQGRVLAELLAHWGLESPMIAAHDIGGAAVLRAHLLHGARVSRVALLDALVTRPRSGGRWGTPWSLHLRRHGTEAFAALPDYLYRGLMQAYVRSAMARSVSDQELEPLLAPFTGSTGQPAFFRQIAQLDESYTDEIEPLLNRVTVPVQLVWGSEDTWLDIDFAERLAAALPHANLTFVDGAGHFIQADAPGAVTRILRAFFRDETHHMSTGS